jgi:hypothetical protein
MLTKTQKEELRHVAQKFLALRPRCAFSAEQALGMLSLRPPLDFTFTAEDLAEAFAFLTGMGRALELMDDLGSTITWQATPDGIKAFERSGR